MMQDPVLDDKFSNKAIESNYKQANDKQLNIDIMSDRSENISKNQQIVSPHDLDTIKSTDFVSNFNIVNDKE